MEKHTEGNDGNARSVYGNPRYDIDSGEQVVTLEDYEKTQATAESYRKKLEQESHSRRFLYTITECHEKFADLMSMLHYAEDIQPGDVTGRLDEIKELILTKTGWSFNDK